MKNEGPLLELFSVTLEALIVLGLLYAADRVGALPGTWDYITRLLWIVMGGTQ